MRRTRRVAPVRRAIAALAPMARRAATRRTTRSGASTSGGGTLIDMGAGLLKSHGRGLLKMGGGALGGLLGGAFTGGAGTGIGSSIGSALADGAATILGMGAYDIKENSLLTTSPTVPVMHDVGNSVRIKHREYIGDVVSSPVAGAFKCVQFHLNPGLSATFPWLSAIANAFEQYELEGYAVEFKSASGDALNSVNTALGSVLMAANYRASAPAFTDKQQMLNSQWAVECKPSVNALLPIECAKGENPFSVMYVRSGGVDEGEDIKMYDLCTINVASSGMQGTSVVLGEVWATYDVLLKKPISTQVSGETLKSALFQKAGNPIECTSAKPFLGLNTTGDDIGMNLTDGATLRFPANCPGKYLITYYIEGTMNQCVAPTFTFTNCASVVTFADKYTWNNVGTVAMQLIFQIAVQVGTVDPSGVADVSMTNTTIPSQPQYCALEVTQVNPGIFP